MRGPVLGPGFLLAALLMACLPGTGCGPERPAGTAPRTQPTAAADTDATTAPPRNTQVQAARQFLQTVLRGDTVVARRWLAGGAPGPATRLAPLVAAGRRRGAAIELYKLGFVVGDEGTLPFVTYAWRADSAVAEARRASLQVVFQDTAARQVLEVWLRE